LSVKGDIFELLDKVDRSGIDNLKIFLSESDFFTAPASGKFHGAHAGALAEHSLNVYRVFNTFRLKYPKLDLSHESVILCSLLHDVCKIGLYLGDNKPYRYNHDVLFRGHAKLSLERISKFLNLTDREKLIIKYHMGIYGTKNFSSHGEFSFSEYVTAISDNAVFFFHVSDMMAARLIEK